LLSTDKIDSELARIIDAWPHLSATAKRMILAAIAAEQNA
jgi:hypothetical protein